MGGELLKAGDCGSLYCDGDSRYVLCFTKFDFGMKQNIMFSFNPNSWECRCCPGKVLLKRSTGSRSEPKTFVLSDQNFQACLPAQPGSSLLCLKIIRVEFEFERQPFGANRDNNPDWFCKPPLEYRPKCLCRGACRRLQKTARFPGWWYLLSTVPLHPLRRHQQHGASQVNS